MEINISQAVTSTYPSVGHRETERWFGLRTSIVLGGQAHNLLTSLVCKLAWAKSHTALGLIEHEAPVCGDFILLKCHSKLQ